MMPPPKITIHDHTEKLEKITRSNMKHTQTVKFGKIEMELPNGFTFGDRQVTVTKQMNEQANREGWNGSQLLCLAVKAAFPEATDISVNGQRLPSRN